MPSETEQVRWFVERSLVKGKANKLKGREICKIRWVTNKNAWTHWDNEAVAREHDEGKVEYHEAEYHFEGKAATELGIDS